MASYATPADLLVRYDARTVGDLVSDTGVRVAAGSLPTDDKLLAALEDASGEIDSALIQARRYTPADLASLTGNSAAYLKRIVCTIAFAFLWERRPWLEREDERDEAMSKGRKILERFRRGEQVFELDGPQDAGLPAVNVPTVTTINNLGLTVDVARRGYYPARHFVR